MTRQSRDAFHPRPLGGRRLERRRIMGKNAEALGSRTLAGEIAMVATREETAVGTAYKVIGTRPVRPDGTDKVTGRALYGADVNLPGMLCGRVLRSPHAHARLLRIDTSRAEALPGVNAVFTRADLPAARDAFK